MTSPRIEALRQLAEEAELERRDFLYESTEQLRRFLDANRKRLAEVGTIVLVDDDQDHLVYHPSDETWTTRLTYQDPADNEWYDEEQVVEAVSEIIELYNPADIFAWLIDAARDPAAHLLPADELQKDAPASRRAARTGSGACRPSSRRRSPLNGSGSWPTPIGPRSPRSRRRPCASSRPTPRRCSVAWAIWSWSTSQMTR